MRRRPMPRPAVTSPPRAVASPGKPFDCEADVLEGLEPFAAAEIAERTGSKAKLVAPQRPGALRFRYSGDLRALLGLRSVVAIYLVRRFDVPRPRALLGHQHFETLIATIEVVRRLWPPGSFTTLRLSAAGEESTVLRRLKDELAQRTGLALADEADLLLRLRRTVDAEGWEVLVRISPRPLATRAWRVCNMPGALNATLAHCMLRLSRPSADDVVVNVACGSGTLLVERLAIGPIRSALGCDTDPAALACARANLAAAGFERLVRLEPWDARQLALPTASVNMICADLPFGQLVGSHQENEALYPQIMAEAARIAVPHARMVLLTHEVRLLERVAAAYARHWRIEEVVRVRSGGMNPRIYLLRRTPAAF